MFYWMNVAGYRLNYLFSDENTCTFFGADLHEAENSPNEFIHVPESMISRYIRAFGGGHSYAEYMNSLYLTSNYLLQFNCCAYHSVAIRVNNKAYLIAADSGVGKTTQYLNLKKLYGGRIEIINGDKPILKFLDDKIIVQSSPWRGKEHFGSDISGELAGVIFLRQYNSNIICRIDPATIVVSSFGKFLFNPDHETTVRKVAELDRQLLNTTPVYLFDNKGDLESSKLLYERVLCGA